MAGDEISAISLLEIAEAVGQIGIKGGKIFDRDRAVEALVREVGDGAVLTQNAECAFGIGFDDSLEGENVGAGSGLEGHCTP